MIHRDGYDRPYSNSYESEIKYSREKNRKLGPKRGVGSAERDFNENKTWSSENVQETGLIERAPL